MTYHDWITIALAVYGGLGVLVTILTYISDPHLRHIRPIMADDDGKPVECTFCWHPALLLMGLLAWPVLTLDLIPDNPIELMDPEARW